MPSDLRSALYRSATRSRKHHISIDLVYIPATFFSLSLNDPDTQLRPWLPHPMPGRVHNACTSAHERYALNTPHTPHAARAAHAVLHVACGLRHRRSSLNTDPPPPPQPLNHTLTPHTPPPPPAECCDFLAINHFGSFCSISVRMSASFLDLLRLSPAERRCRTARR